MLQNLLGQFSVAFCKEPLYDDFLQSTRRVPRCVAKITTRVSRFPALHDDGGALPDLEYRGAWGIFRGPSTLIKLNGALHGYRVQGPSRPLTRYGFHAVPYRTTMEAVA